ncbi:hypothetical protein NUM3379_03460 [Kineococcus sp. NUM-3379]
MDTGPRTLAEELYLLLLDPATGRSRADGQRLELVLAGAVLLELAARGHLEVAAGGLAGVRAERLVVTGEGPVGEPVLDTALRQLRARPGQRPVAALNRLKRALRGQVLERLAERGEVEVERGTVLGFVPVTRVRAVQPQHVESLHADVASALLGAAAPGRRAVALVALVHSVGLVAKLYASRTGLSRRELVRRAGELAAGDWAGAAVRRALRDLQAAAGAAGAAAAAAAASG